MWQATNNFSLEDQINFSNVHQPGTRNFYQRNDRGDGRPQPNETINYPGPFTTTSAAAGASTIEGSPAIGTPWPAGFTGQLYITNNLTGSWDVSPRAMFSLTYRYQNHVIAEGIAA